MRKLRIPMILKWVSSNFPENNYFVSGTLSPIANNSRFYSAEKATKENLKQVSRKPREWKQAQVALLDYLHNTRSLQFVDADNMSKNSPFFLETLLKKVVIDCEKNQIDRAVERYLRYHPINEFELFFETIGLKPCEYSLFLPRNLMFLNDEPILLENYHVLRNYGFKRTKIGRIYKEASEVFRFHPSILLSKLHLLEQSGLKQSSVIKVVISSPCILIGDTKKEVSQVFEKLNCSGIECDWIEGHLKEHISYSWNHMFDLLSLLTKMGCTDLEIGQLITNHPDILFEGSGIKTVSIIVFMLKHGAKRNEISALFVEFPDIPVERFLRNLIQCVEILVELEMCIEDVRWIVRTNSCVLGSCKLKKVASLLSNLNSGKKRLCKIIMNNPSVLKEWVFGARVKRLPSEEDEEKSLIMKTQFLIDLGFKKDSNELKKALRLFRGKGMELQERFDCLVNAGLDKEIVSKMIKVAPHVLNQTKEMIELKLDYLVNGVGYPLSTIIAFPAYVNYTIQRVKLRVSMYNWLKSKGLVDPNLSLSTLLSCTEKAFTRVYVNNYCGGPQYWEKLKKEIYDDDDDA